MGWGAYSSFSGETSLFEIFLFLFDEAPWERYYRSRKSGQNHQFNPTREQHKKVQLNDH
jgi:hypothetical protein